MDICGIPTPMVETSEPLKYVSNKPSAFDELSDISCDTEPAPADLTAIVKESNPKDAIGIKKPPITTVSHGVMMEVGAAMLEGALKYGRHNYREIGVRASVYRDATWRHMALWWDFGEEKASDSGIHHISHAIASLTVLRDGMMMEKWVDDRPPSLPIDLYHELEKAVKDIIAKYPNPKPPFVKT
jgi:hypothetical protein